ncbi:MULTISPECIES: hypothetical protein [unclassified Nocardia]|uniref:hypothetical protein n=1 Tax=unclassified Nocardia TaxID=2637762 RepID=UPI00341991FE
MWLRAPGSVRDGSWSCAGGRRKLARHRAALEAGADPTMVAEWSSDIHRERTVLAAQLTAATNHAVPAQRMSRDEIRQLVDALGGILAILRAADPGDKLEVYRELGLKLTYNHYDHAVTAETNPRPGVGVLSVSGEGIDQYANLLQHRKLLVIGK